VTDNVELKFEFSVEIQTVCTNMHLQCNGKRVMIQERSMLALVLINIFRIGERTVEAILTRTTPLVASMFLNVNINRSNRLGKTKNRK
jgi:hypothetical protein